MRTQRPQRRRGHVRVAIVAAVAALAAGIAVGYLPSYIARPSARRIVNALSTTLPVPDGAKVLVQLPPFGSAGVEVPADDVVVHWQTRMALDITAMTRAQVEAIPSFYEAFLSNAFSDELTGSIWVSNGVPSYGLSRLVTEMLPQTNGWIVNFGGDQLTWRTESRVVGQHLLCEVHAEVMDYEHLQNSPMWQPKGVRNLSDPVQGQRVVLVMLRVQGHGLRDAKNVAWPPMPASTPIGSK